jgi:hypothetical protein
MKRALAGTLAIAFVSLMAAGAMAQVSFFQVYFDDASNDSYGETQSQCGPVFTSASLYLVALNWNMFVAAVDYQVVFPPALLYVSDTYPDTPGGTLNIGNSFDGAALSYGLPRNGFEPMLVSTISALWTGSCDCSPQGVPQPLTVRGFEDKPAPQGVRWPDFAEFTAVGMTSLVCPGAVSTTETTWGGIKALYR